MSFRTQMTTICSTTPSKTQGPSQAYAGMCYLGPNEDKNTRGFVFALNEPESRTRWGDADIHLAMRAIDNH